MALPLGQSPKSAQLANISKAMPVANERVASSLNQGRQTQLQQAIAGAPQAAGPQAAQALGAQQAQQAAAIKAATQEQGVKQQQAVAGLGLQQRGQEAQASIGARSLAAQKQQRDMLNQLSSIDRNLKNKLFDENLSFQKDELGRTLFNDRQLMDYKLSKVKSDEEFRDYEQQVQQLSKRKIQMLQTSLKKVEQALSQQFEGREQQLNQQQKQRLLVAKQELEKKMAREKARQANISSALGAAGTIIGAIVGGPAGAAVGGGAGQIVGSQASQGKE